ncbi:hypothetical protein A1O1_07894 [Capronia coronata CBS 617.96]|uniref:Aminoglycoside phosphotransferase domain-containing protein n=1 Tax=Capronia coronata CBS 617.96 TaxID=1182541 RepID=W9YHT9_9EURO|nr:uncharacterized protein A1O1_07894 [Capronia coronata CBS 617.96]EXJ81829.1 hypothetical protein A1O1_07894 [Capronia coronata CBS 617.96]
MVSDLDHLTASDTEIINWCRGYEQNRLQADRLMGPHTSNVVLRLNDHAVVKFGPNVRPSEAANQRLAYQLLNGNSFLVPAVYHYFQDTSVPKEHWLGRPGYLVMEYLQGTLLSEIAPDELPRPCGTLARAIKAMGLTTSARPGPADGAEPRGNIWAPDYRACVTFHTVDDVETWFNRALVRDGTKVRTIPAWTTAAYSGPDCHHQAATAAIIAEGVHDHDRGDSIGPHCHCLGGATVLSPLGWSLQGLILLPIIHRPPFS